MDGIFRLVKPFFTKENVFCSSVALDRHFENFLRTTAIGSLKRGLMEDDLRHIVRKVIKFEIQANCIFRKPSFRKYGYTGTSIPGPHPSKRSILKSSGDGVLHSKTVKFRTLFTDLIFYSKTEGFGKLICFRLQVQGLETTY